MSAPIEPVRFAHHGRESYALPHPGTRNVSLSLHFEHNNSTALFMSTNDARVLAAALLGAAKIADTLADRLLGIGDTGAGK